METEKDNKITFLDMSVMREPDRCLTTCVYWKPTHTDQYPQSVKHSIIKCLYDWVKCLVTKPSVNFEEKKHLSSVLVSNSYPSSFVQKITKTRNSSPSRESMRQSKSTAVLPYVKGKSEPLRCYLQQLQIHTVFEFNTTLKRHLVWPKDTVNPARQDSMVYRIPCECGKCTLVKQEDLCKRGQEGYTFSPCPDLCCF